MWTRCVGSWATMLMDHPEISTPIKMFDLSYVVLWQQTTRDKVTGYMDGG